MSNKVRTLAFDASHGLPEGPMDLATIVRHQHEAGLRYARSKARLEQLELLRSPLKARLMQRELERAEGKISETRLVHAAEASAEYGRHLELIAAAREEFEIARVVYESLRALFDAKRSEMSYAKAEMNLF